MPSALVAPCTYCVDRHYSRQRRRMGGRGHTGAIEYQRRCWYLLSVDDVLSTSMADIGHHSLINAGTY